MFKIFFRPLKFLTGLRVSLRFAIVAVILLVSVIGYGLFRNLAMKHFLANLPEPTQSVTVAVSREEEWVYTIPAVGTIEAENGVTVASAVEGVVKQIHIASGQAVKKGELLVELDADVEKATLRSVEARVKLHGTIVRRLRRLRKSDTASQAKLDEAEANLSSAEAEAESLRAKIDKKRIMAPFDGSLGLIKIDIGEYVRAGDPIINVQDHGLVRLNASVSQNVIPFLRVGQSVEAKVSAYPDKAFKGTLTAWEPSVDVNGLVRIQVTFTNKDGFLVPGMFMKMAVARDQAVKAVTVPQTAVTYSLHGETLYIITVDDDGDTRAAETYVTTGMRREGRVEILEGLEVNERIVAVGAFKLFHNAKVTFVDDDTLSSLPPIGLE